MLMVDMARLDHWKVVHWPVAAPETGRFHECTAHIVTSLGDGRRQVLAPGERRGNGGGEGAAGAVGAGRVHSPRSILMHTSLIDEQVDNRVIICVTAL